MSTNPLASHNERKRIRVNLNLMAVIYNLCYSRGLLHAKENSGLETQKLNLFTLTLKWSWIYLNIF